MRTNTYEDSAMSSIDLDPIMAKLCHTTRGLGWDFDRASHAIDQYRHWLWLHTVAEDVILSPTPDVDQVWHAHILDTRKYQEDCMTMFGRTLHHNPYAGWESESAEQEHQSNFQQTCQLFELHFGQKFGAQGESGLCSSGYCDADINPSRPAIWRPSAPQSQAVHVTH